MPAVRTAHGRFVAVVATLLVGAAFVSLGALAATAGAVDQAVFNVAQRAVAAGTGAGGARTAQPAVDPAGPAAALTAPALSTTASKTASFKVSWSASPALPSGGWDAFRVEYREPGVDYWLTWQRATTALSATFPGEPGHAYEFRVAAAKTGDPATVGPWSPVKPVAVPVDEASFGYTKTWTRASLSGAYFGKVRSCATKGATATFTFKGTKAALIAPRGRALGKVAVYVRSATADGWTAYRLVKTVDLYAATTRARIATAFGAFDPAVEQQVKFVVTGKKNLRSTSTKVSLDGLAVYGAPRTESFHWVDIRPASPSVVITEQLQFTASIAGCVDQGVEWTAYRLDRYGEWHTDEAGSITADGLYTAPALPSKPMAGEETRSYVVVARGRANPDEVWGSKTVTVTLGPPPVVDDVQPRSAPAGTPVTLTGQHFTDHGGVPQVLFNGVEAQVSSASDTVITAVVPGGWQTWKTSLMMRVWVRTWGVDSSIPADLIFTVTDILPMPPSPWSNGINAASYDDDNASVGDVVRIYGHGFAPSAADNLVRFSPNVVVPADRYEPDPYGDDLGAVYVTVPEGAQTGALGFQRLDGDGRWNDDGPLLEIRPATAPTVTLHPSYNGYVTGPRSARNLSWGEEEWVLSGTDLTKLRITGYSTTTTGVFWLDMRRNGVVHSKIMRALSDTVAVSHRYWGIQEPMPDAIFGDAQGGDTVEIRIRGEELTNRYERTSPWVPVTVGERPVWGAFHYVSVGDLGNWWGPGKVFARGDWLKLVRNSGPATQVLTCPGLWPGELPMGEDGTFTKIVRLGANGTYTLTNQTTGQSETFTVADIGGFGTASYGGWQFEDVQADGLLLRNGGATVEIPPGALPADELPAEYPWYVVSLDHASSDHVAFDPTLTDGGRSFSLEISPEPSRLLAPITITVPYDPEDRSTTPFLGMWVASAGLYYDYGLPPSQIDTTRHTMTMVLPAGDYSGGGGAAGAASKTASDVRAGKTFLPLSTFNYVFRAAGAVSSAFATSGEGYVWHPDGQPTWGIKVDAITDPASASYVPPEKAQEVLDVAAATWTNLAGKGWSEPEAMITITVRDYGDPGVYQGATTKAVFGQPWVYVNSRLTMGKKLDTAVAHEMGHVFQRQLTTNVATQWIDEATAEWVAWDTLGPGGCDLRASFEAGCDFPAVAFPTGFSSGYSAEQAYGAGAFIIWLADTYGPAAVLSIYDTLAYRPGYWYDAHGTFREATGVTVPQLVAGFAPEFWLQTYDPIAAYSFWSRLPGQISAYTGTDVTLSMGADSSRGASVAPTSAFRASLAGKPMVARAPGLPVGATVDVYRDPALPSAIPAAPAKVGTLSSLTPVLDLGVFDGAVGCYRLVAVTPAGAGLTATVTVEAVHVSSVSPGSGSKAGGYSVTLNGCGFGDQTGSVMVGPAYVSGGSVGSWTDTQIVFTMPNMGSETGPQAVQVRPVVGGASNTVTFTTY